MRAIRIDLYLTSEEKKTTRMSSIMKKRSNDRVSYRDRVGESQGERKGKTERKCRKSSSVSHLKQYRY